jgi:hypothetical protein
MLGINTASNNKPEAKLKLDNYDAEIVEDIPEQFDLSRYKKSSKLTHLNNKPQMESQQNSPIIQTYHNHNNTNLNGHIHAPQPLYYNNSLNNTNFINNPNQRFHMNPQFAPNNINSNPNTMNHSGLNNFQNCNQYRYRTIATVNPSSYPLPQYGLNNIVIPNSTQNTHFMSPQSHYTSAKKNSSSVPKYHGMHIFSKRCRARDLAESKIFK